MGMLIILMWIIPIAFGALSADKKGNASWLLPLFLGWLGLLITLFLPYTPEYIKKVNSK